jgi:thioredoxin-related protein
MPAMFSWIITFHQDFKGGKILVAGIQVPLPDQRKEMRGGVFMKSLLIFLFLAMLVSDLPAATKKKELPAGIDWFPGSVEEAFKTAAKDHRLLFLYWGAVWCPPCNQVKKNIFSASAFQKEIKNFIPVYLDGDEPRAQEWGSLLQVQGYPSLVVFNWNREQLTRIPEGTGVTQFVLTLQKTRSGLISVEKILDKQRQQKNLSPDEWEILSTYDWPGDNEAALPENLRLNTFGALYGQCPAEHQESKSRLLMLFLRQLAAEENKNSKIDKEVLRKDLTTLLEKPNLVEANSSTLSYQAAKIIPWLTEKGVPQRRELSNLWIKATNQLYKNNSLPLQERLAALTPMVELLTLDVDQPIGELQKKILAAVEDADKKAQDPYTRQSVMGIALELLLTSRQYEKAKEWGLKEVKKSHSPYYFLRFLSHIAAEEGKAEESLKFMKEAWSQAVGPTTRLEWGLAYLQRIIKLAPQDEKLLGQVAKKVWAEHLPQEGLFEGRAVKRFYSLAEDLNKWNEGKKHGTFITQFKKDTMKICAPTKNNDSCQVWLDTLN